ncbi:MAG TPA: glycine cleavage system protein GcvH [Flavobacteriaceae bacterium]|jgi:glycine cleavage system H protein|nr:glycine cleavage system protein H [Flavobacteriaceae bacterium]MDP7183747.1 glycine cleavage system protein GcvH [Flavobacteriaceae bacterium]HJO70708.1 glycine cleavage system protein GcvH [Flavobacteriaceae bacterium]|tara:strand:- start:7539 stop:7919 length:381 start_codon:yes stop_codon:yes gene_type:complete
MNLPEELKYTEEHEWIKVDGNIATIGITDFAQGELGDIVYIEIDSIGNELNVSEIFGTVEAVKTVSDLFMPIKGTVLEINSNIESTPEIVNEDPYDKGWIIKIEISENRDIENLLSADDYRKMIDN